MEPLKVDLTDVQAAYIAGLLDGEGCIGFNKIRSGSSRRGFTYAGRVQITNTHVETLQWIRALVGFGSIQGLYNTARRNGRWKVCYQVTWMARQARAILPILLPYMHIKRKQAELVLAYLRRQYFAGLKLGLSDDEWNARVKLVEAVSSLNRRGPVDAGSLTQGV